MNSSKNLHHAIKSLDGLPAIPSIAQKILFLKINTDEGERKLLELVETDPPILSKIIGLANSPLYNIGRKVLTLHDAAALLGNKRIKMTALSLAMMSAVTRKSRGLLDVDSLWKHSLAVTMTMETLARMMPKDQRPPDEEVHITGLLHDIGFMVLDCLDSKLSDQFQARLTAEPERSIDEIEAEMLEVNHCELGGELARHWGLPEPIISVLRYHHTPNDERAAVGQPLVTMADLAGKLLPTFCMAESGMENITAEEWRALGIDPANADQIKAKAQEHVRKVAEMNS